MMKLLKRLSVSHLAIILASFFVFACDDPYPFLYETDPEISKLVRQNDPQYPNTSFVVFSDPHYFSPDLLEEPSSAFQDYLDHDRKMLKETPEILDKLIDEIASLTVDFVIIAGDLTKDGEASSHTGFAEKIQSIRASGKKVYVVPGNHDINNGESRRYEGDISERVDTVNPAVFMETYENFGYSTAKFRDPNSLSYVIEPTEGLWLFAIDSCRYRENIDNEHPITEGKLYPETLTWIEQKLIEAIEGKKSVIGFMHHGVLSHYNENDKHYPEYLLGDYQYISEMLAAYGMRFVFTGHFHAQDITKKKWVVPPGIPNHFLFDIETGSLATYPVPYRVVEINNQQMNISSGRIETIESHPDDFPAFAQEYVWNGTILLANEALAGYNVSAKDQALLSPQIADAYITHLQGDEIVPSPMIDLTGLGVMGNLAIAVQGGLIRGWYNDLLPADNEISIDMKTGQILSD